LLPSLAEGVPNVLRESIACGLPYVASATGGIPEISNHSACTLVPPGKSSALADAIADRLRGACTPVDAGMITDSWDEAGRKLGQVLESIQRSGRRSIAGYKSNRNETHDQCAA